MLRRKTVAAFAACCLTWPEAVRGWRKDNQVYSKSGVSIGWSAGTEPHQPPQQSRTPVCALCAAQRGSINRLVAGVCKGTVFDQKRWGGRSCSQSWRHTLANLSNNDNKVTEKKIWLLQISHTEIKDLYEVGDWRELSEEFFESSDLGQRLDL